MSTNADLRNVSLPDSELIDVDRCPACLGESFAQSEKISSPRTLHYTRCRTCNLIFMNPMPSQAWYDAFYANQFWELKAGKSLEKQLKEQWTKQSIRAREYLDILDRVDLSDGAVLEIGCAHGLIVGHIARKLKLKALGIEPSLSARHFAEKHVGIEIIGFTADDLENFNNGTEIKLTLLSNVLENITNPEKTLKLIKSRSNGYVLIATPNPIYTRAVHLFHPFVYSAESMDALLSRLGFDVLLIETGPNDKKQQRILAKPGSGSSYVATPNPVLFPVKRRIGLSLSRLQKRRLKKKPKPSFIPDERDNEILAAMLSEVRD